MHQHKKAQAIKLRSQGKSYNEIRRLLDLPSKGTLSVWFKDIKLSRSAKERLKSKIKVARQRGLFAFNSRRSKNVAKENDKIFKESNKFIHRITDRDLLITGIALYWGEGYKSGKHPKLSFTNSDPQMIIVFMRFIRRILKISDERIRTHIHIHPNLKIKEAVRFWADLTSLKQENFMIVKQVSSASSGVRPKNILPYGTLDIRVNSRQVYFKMMGLINGLFEQILKLY